MWTRPGLEPLIYCFLVRLCYHCATLARIHSKPTRILTIMKGYNILCKIKEKSLNIVSNEFLKKENSL